MTPLPHGWLCLRQGCHKASFVTARWNLGTWRQPFLMRNGHEPHRAREAAPTTPASAVVLNSRYSGGEQMSSWRADVTHSRGKPYTNLLNNSGSFAPIRSKHPYQVPPKARALAPFFSFIKKSWLLGYKSSSSEHSPSYSTPSCLVFMCRVKCQLREAAKSHPSAVHLNGRSPVCLRRWAVRWPRCAAA